MCRKLIFLTSLVVVLTCLSMANAGYELKVDLTVNVGGEPVDYTYKGEPWIAWVRWGNDKETHDATSVSDLGGTGLSVGMGIGNGSSAPGSVLDFTTADDDPICNTWLRSGSDGDPGFAACHLVLYGDGLTPGTYWVYGYHNSPGGSEPTMPRVYVATYSGLNDNLMQNVGAPNDPDGGGVIVEANDVNVPIMHVGDDDLLEPNVSLVKFFTDGSPVKITYENASGSTAVLNAFIIWQASTPQTAWDPFPAAGEGYACPDTSLTWEPGADANTHNVYFGTDLSEEITLFDDDFEAGDANWTASNWAIYDSNVLGDGNSDGNSHSFSHSMTPGSGVGTLTSNTINTSEAGSLRVELWIRTLEGIEAGDIDLYYYDGNSWDFAADLNSIGPNNVWLHYTDEVNESEYLVSTFKIELRSNISGGELFIDDVSVTNTWPTGDEWFVETRDVNNWDPPGILDFNTTYYWRVDEVNENDGNSPWQGRLWSFTTEKGKARNPDPPKSMGSISDAGTTLSWTPSCFATEQKIYFSTEFEEVNESNSVALLGTTDGSDTDMETGSLEFGKRYYWRVNETGPVSLPESDIWYFQTTGYPLMHYTFDGVLDANIGDPWDANFYTDDTGNVTFDRVGSGELRYGQSNPIYNAGGTSAHFKQNGTGGYGNTAGALFRSCFGPDMLDLDGPAYTIEAWVRQDGDANNTQGDIDMDGTIIRKERFTYGLGIDDDGTVKFMHNGQTISSGQTRITRGQWYHIAAVYDVCEPSQNEKLYINGLVVADNNVTTPNPPDDFATDHVGIGAYRYQSETASHIANHFAGAIDELRVVDLALTPEDFLIRGDPNLAWLPTPYNYATEVQPGVALEWFPGQYASSHDVYIGTNWDDINDVNSSNYASYPNVEYSHQDACSYDPCLLELDQTYYWRVDEVSDTCDASPWKGNIWRFTVANYIVIDDMESYTPLGQPGDIFFGWNDGSINWTGSYIYRQAVEPVRDKQSLKYVYDNTFSWGVGYYSEIDTTGGNLDPNNWSALDLKTLSLWFYGKTGNDANVTEQMYVGLEDSGGTYREVKYPMADMNDIRDEEWQEWEVLLSNFTPVNMAKLEKLFIGFGIRGSMVPGGGGLSHWVHFDDIRVYPAYCAPGHRSQGLAELDLNNNCIVDFGDIEIMADEWLVADVNLGEVKEPCDANLVGWWMFDEGDGNVAGDSSGYDHNGVIEALNDDVWWVADRNDGNALEFDGDDGIVRVSDACELRPMHQVSVSAWINYSDEQDSGRVVVKGADNKETYALEVGGNDDLTFYVGDNNSYDPCDDEYVRYFAESNDNELERDEWTHIAGTFDGNTVKCYINGELKDTLDDPNAWGITLCQDTNDLGIGNRPCDTERPFEGTIDDVRVYNCGLSDAEVAYIATDGTGILALESIADIYKEPRGEGAVNLKDFAELAKDWLKKEYWPP